MVAICCPFMYPFSIYLRRVWLDSCRGWKTTLDNSGPSSSECSCIGNKLCRSHYYILYFLGNICIVPTNRNKNYDKCYKKRSCC